MATWLVPHITQTALDTANETPTGISTGDIVYNQTTGEVFIASPVDFTNLSAGNTYKSVGPFEITDGSIDLSSLEDGDGNEVLITDADGNVSLLSVPTGTIVARDSSGNITAQSLQDSMIDDDTISHAKLVEIKPGQVLGALENDDIANNDVPVGAVNISDIRGASVTSSDTAPSDPEENDLWFYAGEEDGDNARLYIYQDSVWVDASPGITNTNAGATGPAGPAGKSVESVIVQERDPDQPIVIQFYDDATTQDSTTFISQVTLQLSELAVGNVPAAPDNGDSDTDYVLQVPSSGDPEWVESSGGGGSVNFLRDNGSYTLVSGDIMNAPKTISLTDLGITGSGIQISNAHTLSYNGLMMQAGSDYNYTTTSITIPGAVMMVLTAGGAFNLINFRATIS